MRYIFEIILIIYLIRMVMRLFSPSRYQQATNSGQQQQYYRQQDFYRQQQQQQQRPTTKEGTVKIDLMPQPKKNQVPDSEGDFIDYEEIK